MSRQRRQGASNYTSTIDSGSAGHHPSHNGLSGSGSPPTVKSELIGFFGFEHDCIYR